MKNQLVLKELSTAEVKERLDNERAMYQKMLTDIENVCRADYNEDKKTAKIENIKDEYTEKFSDVLVTAQNEVAINSIPMEYINNRIAK